MTRPARGALLVFIGGITLRLLASGEYAWFVQGRMQWPLGIAGVIIIAIGLVELATSTGRASAAPRVGWLLLAPVAVLIAVAPTALGAAAASRTDAYLPIDNGIDFEPLPAGDPVAITVTEFVDRALWDRDEGLRDRRVELVGIVVNDADVPRGFRLTRFLVSCCAADGIPVQVVLPDAGVYPNDTWVRATVTWRPPDPDAEDAEDADADADARREPTADVVSIVVLDDPPDTPYESPF